MGRPERCIAQVQASRPFFPPVYCNMGLDLKKKNKKQKQITNQQTKTNLY